MRLTILDATVTRSGIHERCGDLICLALLCRFLFMAALVHYIPQWTEYIYITRGDTALLQQATLLIRPVRLRFYRIALSNGADLNQHFISERCQT